MLCVRVAESKTSPRTRRKFANPGCKQKTLLTGGKVVVANHRVAFRQKPFRQRTADEAGTTGNKVSQLAFLCRLAVDSDQN